MAEEKSEVFRSNAPQEMGVAEGAAAKVKKPARGPNPELRQINDHNATGEAGHHELNEVDIARHADSLAEVVIGKHSDEPGAEPDAATAALAEPEPKSEPVQEPEPEPEAAMPAPPQLIEFEASEDAIPWALSIHLEERIKTLGAQTTAVNQQLDNLETASQKLAKRMAS